MRPLRFLQIILRPSSASGLLTVRRRDLDAILDVFYGHLIPYEAHTPDPRAVA